MSTRKGAQNRTTCAILFKSSKKTGTTNKTILECSGIGGSEVGKSKYLDMLIPEVTTYEYAESNLTGLNDLLKMSTYKQVGFSLL